MVGLLGVIAAAGGGCASSQVEVIVPAQFARINGGIDRIGMTTFEFDLALMGLTSDVEVVRRPKDAAALVSDVAGDLALSLGYDLIERKHLDILLEEKDLSAADLLKPGTGAKVGKTLGIQAVLIGKVRELSHSYMLFGSGMNRVSFSVRLVKLDSGEVLWTMTCDANAIGPARATQASLLRALCQEAASKLREKGAVRIGTE